MKIVDEVKLDFDDVLIKPKSSEAASRSTVNLVRHFDKFPHSKRTLHCVPIMASNMDTVGTIQMAKTLLTEMWITCLHKHYMLGELTKIFNEAGIRGNDWQDNMVACIWYSLGITDKDIAKLIDFSRALDGFEPNLCVDAANGYTDHFVLKVSKIRELFPKSIIMAGNVATPEMVERLIRQGYADIVKIGIGPGSVCTTRIVTGVGYPQLSAILECADAAHGSSHGYICADGGCRNSGDICKAFGANADFVMLGNMLAGTNECGGTKVLNEQRQECVMYRGMASYSAQEEYNGLSDYRASEGRSVLIPCKGPVTEVIRQIQGGIKSCCTYIGASDIRYMGRCTTFVRVNRTHNTVYENHNEPSSKEIRYSATSH